MEILFLTLLDFSTIDERSIYTDLMRMFTKGNHKVNIISPTEKKQKNPVRLIENKNYKMITTQKANKN